MRIKIHAAKGYTGNKVEFHDVGADESVSSHVMANDADKLAAFIRNTLPGYTYDTLMRILLHKEAMEYADRNKGKAAALTAVHAIFVERTGV